MGRIATQLATVQVRAAHAVIRHSVLSGSTERNLNPNLINRLLSMRAISRSRALARACRGPGSDTRKLLSLSRPAGNQNNLTLGLSFGRAVSPGSGRHTRVVTSTYDVARGQFTGDGGIYHARWDEQRPGRGELLRRDPNLEFADDTIPLLPRNTPRIRSAWCRVQSSGQALHVRALTFRAERMRSCPFSPPIRLRSSDSARTLTLSVGSSVSFKATGSR